MARTSLKLKTEKRQKQAQARLSKGLKISFPTRVYNRCKLCGRNHGYMRKFAMCRICFRELARSGKLMGIRKSSW